MESLSFVVVVFLYTVLYKKETERRDKIVRVQVRTASCKPSIGFH